MVVEAGLEGHVLDTCGVGGKVMGVCRASTERWGGPGLEPTCPLPHGTVLPLLPPEVR